LAHLDGMPRGLKITSLTNQILFDSAWTAGVDYDEEDFQDEDFETESEDEEYDKENEEDKYDEAELNGIDEKISKILWSKKFIEYQGFKVKVNVINLYGLTT